MKDNRIICCKQADQGSEVFDFVHRVAKNSVTTTGKEFLVFWEGDTKKVNYLEMLTAMIHGDKSEYMDMSGTQVIHKVYGAIRKLTEARNGEPHRILIVYNYHTDYNSHTNHPAVIFRLFAASIPGDTYAEKNPDEGLQISGDRGQTKTSITLDLNSCRDEEEAVSYFEIMRTLQI